MSVMAGVVLPQHQGERSALTVMVRGSWGTPVSIELEDRQVVCEFCDGAGKREESGVGPVDNTDVWSEVTSCFWCQGTGWDEVEVVEIDRVAYE